MPFHPLWRRFYIAVTVLAVFCGGWLALTRENAPPADRHADSAPHTAQPIATVGVWEDKLAVFPPHGTAPDTVHDVFVSSLPPSEQEALRAGIDVYTETELQRLLEDYTG